MKKIISRFAVLATVAALAAPSHALQWAPYLDAELYGGRSQFSSNDVNGVNGSVVFIPGMKLSDKFSLLPALTLGYRKSRDVQELAGGGFLTQQQQSRSALLKGIYVFTPGWKAKAYASYKQELVKETSGEKWGDGLFDYDKTAGGLELEREGSRWKSLRAGLDYYQTKFPNFQSLASKNFGSEINAGADVLDFDAMDVSLGADLSLGAKSLLSSYLLVSNRAFTDQKIIKRDGTFTNDDRSDMFAYLSVGYRRQMPAWALFHMGVESLAGLDLSYASLNSDQHNYDAKRTKFNENYYDYSELGIGPRYNMRFKEKLGVGLSYLYSMRDYADRPVQNSDGSYTSDTISTNVTTFRTTVSYPLMKGLAIEAQGAWQNSDSNMDYETVYRYSYSSSNYFLGFSYQL